MSQRVSRTYPSLTGPMDEQKKVGTVFVPQMFLNTEFFYAIFSRSMKAETIFKAISALASSGPVFTAASHTHLFSTQTWSN